MLDAQFLLFMSKKKLIKCRGLLMTCHAIKTGLNRISVIYINCTFNSIVERQTLVSVETLCIQFGQTFRLNYSKITTLERIFRIVR